MKSQSAFVSSHKLLLRLCRLPPRLLFTLLTSDIAHWLSAYDAHSWTQLDLWHMTQTADLATSAASLLACEAHSCLHSRQSGLGRVPLPFGHPPPGSGHGYKSVLMNPVF